MTTDASEAPPLVLVDFQRGFDDAGWGERTSHDADGAAATLLEAWREGDRPVAHVRHDSREPDSPLRRGEPGFAYRAGLEPEPDEAEFVKRVNGAFLDDAFAEWVADRPTNELVLCGYTTDHCVSTTARMAENRGYEVTVVRDACAAFDRWLDGERFDPETIHRTALAQLDGEFADVRELEEVLAALPDRDATVDS